MKRIKNWHYIQIVFTLVLLVNCNGKEDIESKPGEQSPGFSENYNYIRYYDKESNTYYYITKINHEDKAGKLIKLRYAHTNKPEGETVREFALRTNAALAFNASTQHGSVPVIAAGVQVVDGKIINGMPSDNRYTLGIRDNNELLVYKPGTTGEQIVKEGVKNAFTAFIPLIEDHKPVSEDVLISGSNSFEKNPRQVIAQLDNLDLLFLSCGGRGFDGDGMVAKDVIRILQGLNVRFAFNLDGGGSVSTVVEGKLITVKIDSNGTVERIRPSFLYVMEN